MRIALITAHYPPAAVACGVGDYTRCLRAALATAGHDTLVITSIRSRTMEPATFPLADRWGGTDLLNVLSCLRDQRPDAVVLQYTPEHYGYGVTFKLLPLCLRRRGPAPLVLTTFHTLVGGRWIAGPWAALLAATSRGVVSTHAELTQLFRRRLPWWARKLREIPIGANIPEPGLDPASARQSLRSRLGLEADATVFATFGFPAPGKGFETLFQALQRVNQSRTVHLGCIGQTREGDRGYRTQLDAIVERLGLARRIHWVGEVSAQEVADLLCGADGYVVPYDEGSSLRRGTLLAGFRAGGPVVTTTPRYPDPSLRPGETILAVPPRSAAALADALLRLLDDPQLQARLRQGVRAAAGRFDWPVIGAAHLDFMEDLRRGGRSCP